MNSMQHNFLRLITLTLLGLTSLMISNQAICQTQSNLPDEQQPVNISADSLIASEKTGKSIYKGNVIITQGSLTLKGETVDISHPKNQLTTVIATGNPATFKRYSQVDQAWLKGRAQKIEYNALNKTVLLVGDALVEQPGKHVISGPKLFYNIEQQTLKAQSSDTEKKRISVTLNPATVKEKDKPANSSTPSKKQAP
ncbi:lipopolysaccharide transport periplasmic protein LptA [Thiomicrorhabdus sp.]|uniref:lipopolysaccharide transport periplasmic protein LptA n=1 Tax=Thiomicrorhabdus sp. TaxID=2039724 RepID=UPI002AA89B5D|nr:lipopolysaccharide transport periplasmic protein LptA [Thiomicrorhabdus sp.]